MARRPCLALYLCLLLASSGCRDVPAREDLRPAVDLGFLGDRGKPDTAPDAAPRQPPCLGYILYSTPHGENQAPLTTLCDMQGKVVRTWPYSGFPAVMLPGGSILAYQGMRDDNISLLQDVVQIVQVSWQGKVTWSFSAWDHDGTNLAMSRQHHDLQLASNPVGYYAPGQDAAPGGELTVLAHRTRRVPALSPKTITDDVIYQVHPDGKLGKFIWQAADHLSSFGFDKSALLDIKQNPGSADDRGISDWLHVNSMALLGRNPWYDYQGDERFAPDNIIIGSRTASFLAIISAETGEVVWRLGPDLSPGQPGAEIGQLVGPHHAHMIPNGLPGAGNILVFDNGGISGYGGPSGFPRYTRAYSRVVELNPRTMRKVWEYGPTSGTKLFFSPALGSAQRLPNGNTFVASGAEGRLFEVTPNGQVVWGHQVKDKNGGTNVYRAYRVPPEWLPAQENIAGYPPWSTACQPP